MNSMSMVTEMAPMREMRYHEVGGTSVENMRIWEVD